MSAATPCPACGGAPDDAAGLAAALHRAVRSLEDDAAGLEHLAGRSGGGFGRPDAQRQQAADARAAADLLHRHARDGERRREADALPDALPDALRRP